MWKGGMEEVVGVIMNALLRRSRRVLMLILMSIAEEK
jgi:hypothetical protein